MFPSSPLRGRRVTRETDPGRRSPRAKNCWRLAGRGPAWGTRMIESITHAGTLLASIVWAEATPEKTTFVTPVDCPQQVGFIVHRAGGSVPRHRHLPV